MADVKISALSAGSALAGTEVLPMVQSADTVTTTPAAILTFLETASIVFSAAAAGITLKRGSNGLCGTFVCNGVTPVSVSNTNVAITDCIIISLNTVGGTVGATPHVATITGTSGFTTVGSATDTSTYNYAIIKNLA